MKRFQQILWFIYISLLPIYVFHSGLPQIADYLMLFMMAFLFILAIMNHEKLDRIFVNRILPLVFFVIYALLITIFWVVYENNTALLLYPAYYLYDFIVLVLIYESYKKYREAFLSVVFYSFGISVVSQFLFSFILIGSSHSIRQSLFFKNPNQLGYYALTTACILVMVSEMIEVKKILKLFFLFCVTWLALISLSKAAIISVLVLLIIHFLRKPILLAVGGAFLALIFFSFNIIPSFRTSSVTTVNNAKNRINNIGKANDDNLDQRGYMKLVNYPQYMFFGAAEGASIDRSYLDYSKSDFYGEFHSTWGTLLFCYGLIGSGIFLLFCLGLFLNNKLIYFAYFIPLILYGLTHQGLRFTQFWFFLSLLLISKIYQK